MIETSVAALQIRPWQEDDNVAALTDLLHCAYARLGRLGFNYTAVDQSVAVTLERIRSGECIIALDGAGLCGTLLFKDCARTSGCAWYDRPDTASVSQFAVAPDRQGLGIGGALLGVAEQLARRAGAAELALDTAEGAHHLLGFYQRRGYRPVDSLGRDGKTYDSIVLSKCLAMSEA
ncbi:GNAT family N-acetyltransferase [Sphingomonas sp.]|uniref:GNAT family N-acetyltransferase n=1 Tax=Sphingomonas sp. TaxID=28214 RepID=UPI0025D67F64|nr:GNAT family N-acetyltransferase [Sphingomonas sp.]